MGGLSFYWHDYETFGTDPARDRPSQFAGIRTDADFNIIGDPLVIYCRLADDSLPQPEAVLVTGITPQLTRKKGLIESEFIAAIHAEMAQPNTCSVGYNSIRFDDEVTRYSLYRNFFDPYAREWQNGNSRWDLIDLVRACRALRPEGINWPNHPDGSPSFRLEDLTVANGISHESAHDALSDVHATIAMARLIKQAQPKLFDYYLKLRDKREVAKLLNIRDKTPVLHTTGMFPSSQLCTSMIVPLAPHPSNKNAVLCVDLREDPSDLIKADVETIKARLFTPADQLGEGERRMPVKNIHLNKCPMVATTNLLNDTIAERIGLDKDLCERHYQAILQSEDLPDRLIEVFTQATLPEITDPDAMLYSGGFFNDEDKQTMRQLRGCSGEQLSERSFYFHDKRLNEMLFRYRGRNFPEHFNEEEQQLWQEYCYSRLTEPEGGGSICMESYLERVHKLQEEHTDSPEKQQLLQALLDYADELLA